LQAGFANGEAY
jgi:CheY-like chemotaxis protein